MLSREGCFVMVAVIIIVGVGYLLEWEFLSIIGCLISAYVIYDLLSYRDDAMPIGEIALVIGAIQWIIAPIVSYSVKSEIYQMSVPENEYLAITLTLYIAFFAGIMIFRPRKYWKIDKQELILYCKSHIIAIKYLIGAGLLISLIPLNISAINFIRTLAECLLYIGTIMLMFAIPKKAAIVMGCVLGYTFLRSIIGGMFHDLMVWSIFLILSLFYLNDYSLKKRFVVIGVLLVGITTLQSIKPIYRSYTWQGSYSGNQVTLFLNLFAQSLFGELELNATQEGANISRFNQGWIISRIYNHIPTKQEYLGGKTIWEGAISSAVPRVLNPDKKGSGKESIQDFETFTGYHLNSKTSMGLSILGEAYGNFGILGGGAFMFVWGCLIAFFLNIIIKLASKSGYWLFFTPLICFNLIKAEINFVSVLNWTVKAFIFSFVVIYLLNKFFFENKCCQYSVGANE